MNTAPVNLGMLSSEGYALFNHLCGAASRAGRGLSWSQLKAAHRLAHMLMDDQPDLGTVDALLEPLGLSQDDLRAVQDHERKAA